MGLDLDRAALITPQRPVSEARLPERSPSSFSETLAAMALRILLSVLASGALVALAVSGLFVTAAPKFISMMVEPFSLLLLPGLIVAALAAGLHDYSPYVAIQGSLAFYFVVFYGMLRWRSRWKRQR